MIALKYILFFIVINIFANWMTSLIVGGIEYKQDFDDF